MELRDEGVVAARRGEEQAQRAAVIRQIRKEADRRRVGSGDVSEGRIGQRGFLPAVAGRETNGRRNGGGDADGDQFAFHGEDVAGWSLRDGDEVRVAGGAAEGSGRGDFAHDIQWNRADGRAGGIRFAEGDEHVIAAAAFFVQRFDVVGLAGVQRHGRGDGARILHGDVGVGHMDEHGASGRIGAVRGIDVHPELDAVITTGVEPIVTRVGRDELTGDAGAVVF